ncbi:hypothetical protein V8G54_036178 [Vigna mungo]|uniref:Uncharacterized protein n=1 Tax=Vigna mungo TaxID=3915 RepID=A0AAQ3MGP0_VIGMU
MPTSPANLHISLTSSHCKKPFIFSFFLSLSISANTILLTSHTVPHKSSLKSPEPNDAVSTPLPFSISAVTLSTIPTSMPSTVALSDSGYASFTFFRIIHTNRDRNSFVASSFSSTASFCVAWTLGSMRALVGWEE